MSGFKKTYKLPFKFNIPNYTRDFFEKNSILKSWFKFIKRSLYIFLFDQKSLEISNILPSHKNLIWINISAPSLGDSLMDLSSRVLLEGRKVDLYTDKKNANLYRDDVVFSTIFSNKKEVDKSDYDLVIIDSYSTRSMSIKNVIAPLTPYVGMFGFYNGIEVNRVLFSFHRMNHLLGYLKNEEEINRIAKSSMSISTEDKIIVNHAKLPKFFIAIVLGGEWGFRTFKKWDQVVERLLKKDNNLNIVLIGSDNAQETEKVILRKFSNPNILSYVAQFTFNQTAQIIRQAQLLFCCDGGLMHSANTNSTIIIPLFARLTPEMQLTESFCAFSLFDEKDVNNISVEDILQKYEEAFNCDCNHPLGE